jgi:hypothetical protein
MQGHVSRVVGFEGFEVKDLIDEGDRIDLDRAGSRGPPPAPL